MTNTPAPSHVSTSRALAPYLTPERAYDQGLTAARVFHRTPPQHTPVVSRRDNPYPHLPGRHHYNARVLHYAWLRGYDEYTAPHATTVL